jgi:hypothetical protein
MLCDVGMSTQISTDGANTAVGRLENLVTCRGRRPFWPAFTLADAVLDSDTGSFYGTAGTVTAMRKCVLASCLLAAREGRARKLGTTGGSVFLLFLEEKSCSF